MNSFCIATWNLNYLSPNGESAKVCRAKMLEAKADVWILTEIRKGFNPGEEFCLIAESELASDLAEDWRWTSIWVHKSLFGSKIDTRDPERTTCARLEIPGGFPLYVYGTVLPWRGSTWHRYTSAGGRAFSEALAVQKADWLDIQKNGQQSLLCVAGDFNQDLLEIGHYYGSKKERQMLEEALSEVHLSCLTAGKSDPVAKQDPSKATVDHICLGGTRPPIFNVKVDAWSPQQQGKTLSDHYGVWAQFSYS